MGLVDAILQGSFVVREMVDKGVQEGFEKGREEGEAKGRTHEAQSLLRSALSRKFPGLDQLPEIDAISNIDVLEALLLNEVFTSSDRERVQTAIIAAAKAG